MYKEYNYTFPKVVIYVYDTYFYIIFYIRRGQNPLLDVSNKNGSTIWNSILKVKSVLRDGFVFWLGNDTTPFWYFFWTILGTFASMVPWVDIHYVSLCIRDWIVDGNWNFIPWIALFLLVFGDHWGTMVLHSSRS